MATTQAEITRLQNARNKLRNKGVALGIASSADKLDELAEEFDGIVNQGTVNATVKEGETYTIEPGYYQGGTVGGVGGGGNYQLQEKTVTPTKQQQTVTSDSGYYGLSHVIVRPIPDAYQDVTSTTLTPDKALANTVFVDAGGVTQAGTMPNNGTVTKSINGLSETSVAIPAGYTAGGTVSLTNDIENALAAI